MNGPASITVAIAEGDEQFLGQLEDWLANEPTIEVVGSVHDG
ncbi:MAG: hypothetical protein JWO59_647, partial [Chloroflexi bacterium]|nr:hypothetical protein [Chloroflexota bacterium]